jgi:hypothetical protein
LPRPPARFGKPLWKKKDRKDGIGAAAIPAVAPPISFRSGGHRPLPGSPDVTRAPDGGDMAA